MVTVVKFTYSEVRSMSELIYKRDKTAKDIDELLAKHKNLIYYMLSNMGQLTNQDAESVAWEALWDAVCTFDVYSNTAFCTYACTVIRNAVNNILRKQQLDNGHCCSMMQLAESENLVSVQELDNADLVSTIDKSFEQYIKNKSGVARNILLTWYGTSFSANVSNIARICSCSASYVTRTQDGFRAYMSGILKGL